MAKVIDVLKAYILLGASQEQAQDPDFAEDTVNTLSNADLLRVLESACEWEQSLSPEELQALEQ